MSPDVALIKPDIAPQKHAALVRQPTTPRPIQRQPFTASPAPLQSAFAFTPQSPLAFSPAGIIGPEQPAAFPATQAPLPPPQPRPVVEAVRSSGGSVKPVPIFAIPGALPASVTAAPFQQPPPPPPPPALPPAPVQKGAAPLGNKIPQEVSIVQNEKDLYNFY